MTRDDYYDYASSWAPKPHVFDWERDCPELRGREVPWVDVVLVMFWVAWLITVTLLTFSGS